MLLALFLILFMVCLTVAGRYTAGNGNKTGITIADSDDTYKLTAVYDKSKTSNVQGAIDKSLKNVTVDATMTLDEKMTIYIKASPGQLKLIFPKEQNSPAAYTAIKRIGTRIKAILAE